MAGGFSIYAANRILNKVMRGTDFTSPTASGSLWVALFTGVNDGSDTGPLRNNNLGGATEVANANGYQRIEVDGATGIQWYDALTGAGGITENSSAIVFPQATGSWGTIYAAALIDSATHGAGNVWVFGPLVTPKTVGSPDVFRFQANNFDVLC